MVRRASQLSLVYGGRSRPYDIRGVQCRLVTAASCPAGLDGYVLEEDTHRILTVDSVMTYTEEHPVRLMTELRTSGPCPVGSLVVRGKRWYAVVIDLDQEPLCQSQWITMAYANIARRIRDNEVRRMATHLLGHIHGNYPLETCCHYLMVSLAQQEWQRLRADAQLDWCRNQDGVKIAVNSSIFTAPWADICFAGDHHWWKFYHRKVKELDCERWSFSQNCAQFGVRVVKKNPKQHPLTDGVAAGTSGTAAAEFAYLQGAEEIFLLGVDCKVTDKTHHHGDHPEGLSNPHDRALRRFGEDWQNFAANNDVRLINLSPICDLDCFEYRTIDGN